MNRIDPLPSIPHQSINQSISIHSFPFTWSAPSILLPQINKDQCHIHWSSIIILPVLTFHIKWVNALYWFIPSIDLSSRLLPWMSMKSVGIPYCWIRKKKKTEVFWKKCVWCASMQVERHDLYWVYMQLFFSRRFSLPSQPSTVTSRKLHNSTSSSSISLLLAVKVLGSSRPASAAPSISAAGSPGALMASL